MAANPLAKTPILCRIFSLKLMIASSVICALSWYAGGITWLYDSEQGYSPLIACPVLDWSSHAVEPSGPSCRTSLFFNTSLASYLAGAGLLSPEPSSQVKGKCSLSQLSSPEYIYCYWSRPCFEVCETDAEGHTCPDSSKLVDPRTVFAPQLLPQCRVFMGALGYMQFACFYVSVDSFCDQRFTITPGNTVAMRGIIIASVLITIIWTTAEVILYSIEKRIRIENAAGHEYHQATLPAKQAQVRAILEQRWNTGDPHSNHIASSSRSWRRRLVQYHSLREEGKSSFKSREWFRSLFLYCFYFVSLICTLYFVIKISPQHIRVSDSPAWISVITGQISVYNIHSVLDIFLFADIILDLGLFGVAVATIDWPKAPVFSRHLKLQMDHLLVKNQLEECLSDDQITSLDLSISQSSDDSTSFSESLSFVLRQSPVVDCCLLIACHESNLTIEKSQTFTNTIQSALSVFPPSHIFVCDNGNSIAPVDDTEMATHSIHPDINYIYVPEGNKTFALYWCNKYWIPKCWESEFKYALIIDDDVPLPPDLHIPLEQLRQDTNIKAVHFAISAVSPNCDDKSNVLIACQDIEYKLAALHKQFQAKLSRCLCCHGAIALWDRNCMDEIFLDHDTVFHGEDLMMGLCLLKRRDKSRIISASHTIVPTYAPSSFAMLFRQRVKSWELTSHRKTWTYLGEFLNPKSFCHIPSLTLKPYFLQEIFSIILDWLRIYLLCGLALRDWQALLVMTAFFTILIYVQVIIFAYIVLRSRKDLRPPNVAILCFPLFRLCGLLFRVCALCQNLLVYSHSRNSITIGKREDEIHDIPPLPQAKQSDWSSIWQLSMVVD